MPPASKSKSKDKKTSKELMKASGKLAGSVNGCGVPLSAYSPFIGSFHALDLETSSSAPSSQANGRFRSIDENDLNGHFVGTGGEFDAVSNNGSWSGESEEHKEKFANQSIRQEAVPGTENDKREKIRHKNERKHQRQKERRNLELREKCGGYIMSRKLDCLSQQLVAMGFSAERSTMALILNEGKVDQSVAWLIDEGADEVEGDRQRDQKFGASGNLKIDISVELARIAELEIIYKCTRQEVERAVVACEGDIDKAAEVLKSQKHERPAVSLKPEETGDPPTPVTNGFKHSSSTNQYPAIAPTRPNSSTSITSQVRDEKDFNYTKTVATTGILPDNSKNAVQVQQKRVPPRPDWSKSHQIVPPVSEKRWPVLGSSSEVTTPVASPLQVSPRPPSAEVRYPRSESRNVQQIGAVREPVTVMQRQQPQTSKPFVVTSIATSTHTTMPSWHPIGGSDFDGNGIVAQMATLRNFNTNNTSPNQLYQQQHMYQHQQQAPNCNNPMDTIRHPKTNGVVSKLATSSTLTPASSLGLFPGTIAPNVPSGSSSPVDWLNGFDMRQIDYANIDWSLNRNTLPSMESSLWPGDGMGLSPSFMASGTHHVESQNGISGPRPGSSKGTNGSGIGMAIPTTMVGGELVKLGTAMHDWSSPFEENDVFYLPRQFTSSHSMYEGHRGV